GLNRIAIAVTSSGIAALLMSGGKTAHFRFKIPLKLIKTTTLNIKKQSDLADLIRKAKVILWDEAPMMDRFAFEAVDRSFRDLMDVNEPFGGKVMVLGGDFRQILSVVVRGTRAQIVNACLKSSDLWKFFTSMKLTKNMRVQQQENVEQKNFVDFLLQVGEGKVLVYSDIGDDFIQLPDDIVLSSKDDKNLEKLISEIFNDINTNYQNSDYIEDRAILTTKNIDVEKINDQILKSIPDKQVFEYKSADSIEEKEEVDSSLYTLEFLNSLTPSGMPPHELNLKIDVPVILLRNINPAEGLYNGTRLIIKNCYDYIFEAEILTGVNQGKKIFLPRIRLTPSDLDLLFQLVRRQFPIKLSFAMTINKVQGQTIPIMGLYLPKSVFTHGQLYVALSRVQSKNNIKVLVEDRHKKEKEGIYTKNIVYREIFAESE
ncbi:3716_t:CDS:1, partial [Ambispora leptoticha]